MKWTYLPIIFALAFIYTKASFNEINRNIGSANVFARNSSRAPAAIVEKKYSNIAMKRISTSALYKNLNEPILNDIFKNALKFKGTIVESFGFVIDDYGKASFSLVEFSDVTIGHYAYDVMAHLSSSKTLEKKVSWIPYFDAYKAGLQNQPHIYSYYVEKGVDEAISEAEKVFEDNVSSNIPFEFTSMKKFNHHPLISRNNEIQKELKNKFPKIQFFDLYESNVDSKTYQALVRMRPQDKIQWMELYESSICDYDQAFNKQAESISFQKCYELLRNDIFDGRLNKSLNSVMIEKKNYIMKFSDQFPAKILRANIPADDYVDIALDEAYLLGRIHRTSLKEKTSDYIKAWATIPAAVIDEKIIELKYKLKDLQE
jgi:hypothetical protein